jgi:hypothetical protein
MSVFAPVYYKNKIETFINGLNIRKYSTQSILLYQLNFDLIYRGLKPGYLDANRGPLD